MTIVFNKRWLDVTLLGSEEDNPSRSNMKVKASKRTDICVELRKEGKGSGENAGYKRKPLQSPPGAKKTTAFVDCV